MIENKTLCIAIFSIDMMIRTCLFADMEYNFSSIELNQVICASSVNNLLRNTIDTLI